MEVGSDLWAVSAGMRLLMERGPRSMYTHDFVQRFLSKIDILYPNTTACWPIDSGVTRDSRGYPMMRVGDHMVGMHRIGYRMFVGDIPAGYEVDHTCNRRDCGNFFHYEAVTPRVNTLRSGNPASINFRKTVCPQGHEYTDDNTRMGSDRRRHCRECERVGARRRRAERKGMRDKTFR